MDEEIVQAETMHPYFGMESSKRAPSTVESIAENAGSDIPAQGQESILMSGLASSVNGPNGPGQSDLSGLPDLPPLPIGMVHIPQGMTIHYNPSITTSSTMMGAATRTTMSPMPNWLSTSSRVVSSSMGPGAGNGLHHNPHYYYSTMSTPWRHTVPSTMPWASLNGSPQMKFTAPGTAGHVVGMSLQTMGMTRQPYYERFPAKQLKRKCHIDAGAHRSCDAHLCFHEHSGTRPNKLYISEERMAARMQELTLENNNDHLQPDRESSWGQSRRNAERALQDLEERISSEEEEEEDANHNVGPRIELDAQLQLELKKRTKDLLPSFLLDEMTKPNMQLVLWKPPGDQVKEVVAKVQQHQKLATEVPPDGNIVSPSPVPMPMDDVSLNGISPPTNSLPLPDLLMNHQSSSLQGKPIGCNGTSITHNHNGPPQANPLSVSAPLDTVFEGMDDDMEL